jgi:hypothetical protein
MTALRDSARRYKEESGPESPESLMISALVGTGQFVPAKYGLSVDDCESWTRVWRWCEQHQAETGEAPGIALLKTSWPEFVFTQDVKVVWAAKELGADSEKRRMLTAVRGALANLSNGEIEEAKISLAQAYISRPAGKPGDSVWQMEGIESVVAAGRSLTTLWAESPAVSAPQSSGTSLEHPALARRCSWPTTCRSF